MATRRWTGAALPVAQRETITIGGTWVAADTLTVTCNGRAIVLTVGTTVTTTQIATELAAALGSTSTALGAAYSVTERGPNVAEFREFVSGETAPAASGSTVVLVGKTKGKPFTITVSKSSTSGTVSTATTISASGPNFFNVAANWSGSTVPVDTDDIVYDSGNVDCLYGLAQSAVTPASITITQGYTGRIGLARINVDDSAYPYTEYRDRFLALGDSSDAATTSVTIGAGEGNGSSRIQLDSGSGQAVVVILNSGTPELTGIPAIQWIGTHASNTVSISKGSVGIAYRAGEVATVATLSVGFRTNLAGDSAVWCGSGCTLTTINQSGGALETNSAVTTMTLTGGVWSHLAGAVTTANINGGACRYRATSTLTTANVGSGGELDFRQDPRSRTVTNCDMFEGASLRDPIGTVTFTNGIDLNRCDLSNVVLEINKNRRITLGSVS
jgi:hypothetical protein